jgi:hypothetical protein
MKNVKNKLDCPSTESFMTMLISIEISLGFEKLLRIDKL